MASNLRVDSIVPATGANVSIGTATGGVNIPGVLTYEDVTNVDSIGIITARSGINGPSALSLKTGGTERLNINSVGITSVQGVDDQDNFIVNVSGNEFAVHTDGSDGEISLRAQDGSGNNYSKYMTFFTHPSGSAAEERLRITSDGKLGVNTTAPVETVGIAGSMRFITSNGTKRMITALPSGSYATSVSGGSAIGFERIADGGGGSDEIYFETHWQGNRHGESMRINKKGHVTKPMHPAFHASRRGGNVSSNNYVVFDQVDSNNGSHYNNSDGKFTAPVAGIYFFAAWQYTGGTCAYSLRINGTQFGEYAWSDDGGHASWVASMTVGQYAQIYTQGYTWRGTAGYHNGFCGYLIG